MVRYETDNKGLNVPEQLATFLTSFPIDFVYEKLARKVANCDYVTTGVLGQLEL